MLSIVTRKARYYAGQIIYRMLIVLFCLMQPAIGSASGETVFHDMAIVLLPDRHEIQVTDRIRLPQSKRLKFSLHAHLTIDSVEGGQVAPLLSGTVKGAPVPLKHYTLTAAPSTEFVIHEQQL